MPRLYHRLTSSYLVNLTSHVFSGSVSSALSFEVESNRLSLERLLSQRSPRCYTRAAAASLTAMLEIQIPAILPTTIIPIQTNGSETLITEGLLNRPLASLLVIQSLETDNI